MVTGVTEGYEKKLNLVGTGYRVKKEGSKLVLSLGFSHPVEVDAPEGIEFEVEDNDKIVVSGADKQKVGQIAANIRAKREPEPYKGKGIKYEEEVVRRKPGKAAKAAA
jgi:large subunit ribosomal protein L6